MSFRSDNHYVPCEYLKRWASSDGRIWTYRTLVPDCQVPLWREYSPKGVAYYRHLYTRIVAGQETDEIERWFDTEIEAPAAEALQKATSDAQLTPVDWKRLVRFLAAQQVRTPQWFAEQVRRWELDLPGVMEAALRDSVQMRDETVQLGQPLPRPKPVNGDDFPWRVIAEHQPGQEMGRLGVEVLVGRGLWLSNIKHVLTQTVNVLHRRRWTILLPPEGLAWFTSDDPVVCLNFSSPTKYNFRGGWESPDTAIFLPLGPQHLLYTQMGTLPPLYTQIDKPLPRRGERMPQGHANFVRRCIAEHAHRMVFAAERDADVPRLRPRFVNADIWRYEREQWSMWNDQQTAAEQDLGTSGRFNERR